MKIEKLNLDDDDISKINELIDAHNAAEDKGQIATAARDVISAQDQRIKDLEVKVAVQGKWIDRLEAENARLKPLRDGDCVWDELNQNIKVSFDGMSKWMATDAIKFKNDRRLFFNILDLAAAIRRGEKIITLTKEEVKSVMRWSGGMCLDSIHDKLRAAMMELNI